MTRPPVTHPAADRALDALAHLFECTREGTLRSLPPDELAAVLQAVHEQAGRITGIAYRAGCDTPALRLALVPFWLIGEAGR